MIKGLYTKILTGPTRSTLALRAKGLRPAERLLPGGLELDFLRLGNPL